MAKKQRHYGDEYKRRLERAAARGLSRSQARGHARASETPVRATATVSDGRLEAALKELRRTGKQGRAAKVAGVSAERFRRFLREKSLAKRDGRTWTITDERPREVLIISRGQERRISVRGFEPASRIGHHSNAVRRLLVKNDPSELAPFVGQSIKDLSGRMHPFETDENALYRLAAAGGEGFEQVYRLAS